MCRQIKIAVSEDQLKEHGDKIANVVESKLTELFKAKGEDSIKDQSLADVLKAL